MDAIDLVFMIGIVVVITFLVAKGHAEGSGSIAYVMAAFVAIATVYGLAFNLSGAWWGVVFTTILAGVGWAANRH